MFRRAAKDIGRFLLVGVLLLAYLSSGARVGSAMTAALAWVDGQHRILVATGPAGCRVVLSHDLSNPSTSPGHRHGWAVHWLVGLAGDAPSTPDHVLHFAAGDLSGRRISEGTCDVPAAAHHRPSVLMHPGDLGPGNGSVGPFPSLPDPPATAAVTVARAVVRLI